MTRAPPAYLINLDRSRHRLRSFREINAHLKQVTRFAAVDGATLDRAALISAGYVAENLTYGPGTLGCSMSHIRLWEMAAAEARAITVFEDDAVLSHGFDEQAAAVIARLPDDWDIVLWGCRLNPSFAWVDLGETKIRLEPYGVARHDSDEDLKRLQAASIAPSPVRLLHAFGTHAYSISAKGARAVLDHCLPLRDQLIVFEGADVVIHDDAHDMSLCGLYPRLQAFLCIPNLAWYCTGASVRDTIDAAANPP